MTKKCLMSKADHYFKHYALYRVSLSVLYCVEPTHTQHDTSTYSHQILNQGELIFDCQLLLYLINL